MKLLSKIFPVLIFLFLTLIFFKPFFLENKLPIPADAIVGMYHPWRDFYAKDYPQGIPFKNFLITDPVRQQYVWRYLAIEEIKSGQLPLWNPYNFSGTPLLANFQSAVCYPLNILFFLLPFNLAWGMLILFEPFLAGLFLYFYLRNLRIEKFSCFLGGFVFSFSGFFIAWLEWGTILHSALWLPLILLSIDRIFADRKTKKKSIWLGLFILALTSSFLAGHLQTFFYVGVLTTVYFLLRWWQNKKIVKIILLFAICYLLFAILTAIQWLPMVQFINLSARSLDLPNWQNSSWFLPPQNLVQFLAPDFFGNPATLNYWGIWNYGEFIGYLGILPIILVTLALFFRHDKKTIFFGGAVLLSLIFVLPTPLARLPYQLQLPLISTSQPTRLMFLVDFSLSILAALGFDWFINRFNDANHFKKITRVILIFTLIFGSLWVVSLAGQNYFKGVTSENLTTARRNLILPTILFIMSQVFFLGAYFAKKKKGLTLIMYIIVAILVVFDLFRFGWKFTPFTKEGWIFPRTETINFLTSQPKPSRLMTTDRKIFPPNFASFYRLEDVSGYDPLYLKTYQELVAAWVRGKPDISPFSFNRILTPEDYSSRIADLLNVKYVLSLKDEPSAKLKLVFQEGQTRVYENSYAYPRAFLVYNYKVASSRQEAINFLFDKDIDLHQTAILEQEPSIKLEGLDKKGEASIISYEPQKIFIKTKSQKPAILVLADIFYPGWQVFLDNKTNSEKIFRVDFILRGIIVPEGEHTIKFSPSL